MAWQLVYTSAPRLLEAGRSGFGTVARHRQISPLLVSAIERASQFARQPGHDAGRVIFCHRILAVAGGRFHVLSCIRDAGADYTGRTNHLAHHLIVEPREVAALGRRAPSPADVLLGFSWIEAWNEAPRFLEASDEIAVEQFAIQAHGQWEQATGDAKNAWLLAHGEASRGAHVFLPAGIDARGLFAESLRLAPDRLWQIPFTTALQPSDESSDFRWIGVEEESTLRMQAETSGRPVLDLTRPDLLPEPQIPANAAIASLPRPSAISTGSTPATARDAPIESAIPQRRTTLPKDPAGPSAGKRNHRTWIIAASAALLLGIIAVAVIRPLVAGSGDLRERREQLKKRIVACRIFSPQTADFAARLGPEKLSPAEQIVSEIEKAAAALKGTSFAKMRDCKTGDALKQMGDDSGIEVPAELQSFATHVHEVAALDSALALAAAATPTGRANYEALQRQLGAIESFAKATQALMAFSPALDELRKGHERSEAATLLALLHPRGSPSQQSPPAEGVLVEERLARGKPADAMAAKTFREAEKLMQDWNFVRKTPTDRVADNLAIKLRDARDTWPEWLLKLANATLAKSRGESTPTTTAAPIVSVKRPSIPLYFFSELSALNDAHFQELERGATFQLRTSPGAVPVPLIDPTNLGKLRRQINDPVLFSINEPAKQITPERAADSIAKPLILTARNVAGRDALQVWITNETEKPLLPKTSAGLSRSGNSLTLDPEKLGVPGVPTSRMTLRLPTGIAGAGTRLESLTVTDWAVDLEPLVAGITHAAKESARQLKALESPGTPQHGGDASARFKELKKAIADGINRTIEEWAMVERKRVEKRVSDVVKREPYFKAIEAQRTLRLAQARTDFGDDLATLSSQAGGCIKAFCQDATFQGRDPLFTAGANLVSLKATSGPKDVELAFRSARREAEAAVRKLATSEEIGRYQGGLRTLAAMVTLLSPEIPESKSDLAKHAALLAVKQEESRRNNAHPLLSEKLPGGVYRLFVQAGGVEIPLVEIEINR